MALSADDQPVLSNVDVPVEFLTHKQARRYGRFVEDPSPDQLDRYLFLDDSDVAVIGRKRTDRNRPGVWCCSW